MITYYDFRSSLGQPVTVGSTYLLIEGKRLLKPAQRLRELLASPGMIIAPGAYDALSAKLVEQAGFDVVLIAGGTYSNFHFGIPDNGFITQDELIEAGRRITAVTDLPLILDFDDAGGSPLQAFRGVQLAEQAGVAALLVEDMIPATKHFWTPKDGGDRWKPQLKLRSVEEMSNIIRACAEARTSPDTVIVARSDAARFGFDDLAERMAAYSAAGADMLYPCGFPLLELPKLTEVVPGQYMMVTVKNPTLEERQELEAAGVKILLVINTINGAVAGFRDNLSRLTRGELLEGEATGGAYTPIMEAIDAAEWARRARHYGYS